MNRPLQTQYTYAAYSGCDVEQMKYAVDRNEHTECESSRDAVLFRYGRYYGVPYAYTGQYALRAKHVFIRHKDSKYCWDIISGRAHECLGKSHPTGGTDRWTRERG